MDNPTRYRFGRLTLDTGRRQLTSGRRPIRLGRLTFDLLQALVESSPNVLSHDELAQRVWGGRPVSPETLSQRVKLLRDALSDQADDPRYVEVIRGHGHRLIPTVRVLPSTSAGPRWPGPLLVFASAMTALAVMLAATLILGPGAGILGGAASPAVAVIPFAPVQGGQADYSLGELFAEAVIEELTKADGLEVFPSSATFPFREDIGGLHATDRGPGASHVLKGNLEVIDGGIVLSAQLIECATGYQIWGDSKTLEGEGLGAGRIEFASFVAGAVEERLSGAVDRIDRVASIQH